MTTSDPDISAGPPARCSPRVPCAVVAVAVLCAAFVLGPLAAQGGSFERVVVEVVSDGNKKSQPMVDRLSVAIVTKLRETGTFKRVAARGIGVETEFDLVVTVAPGNMRNADKGAFAVGALAGRSKIDVIATLADAVSGETLGEQAFNSESKLAATIFSSANSSQAVEGIATQVAEFVRSEVERRQQ